MSCEYCHVQHEVVLFKSCKMEFPEPFDVDDNVPGIQSDSTRGVSMQIGRNDVDDAGIVEALDDTVAGERHIVDGVLRKCVCCVKLL